MNLSERLRQLIEAVTSSTRRFVALEEQTGVKAETWRTWWNRGGKASADLIQAAAQTWPEYAFWLVTGVDDFLNGHTSPPNPEKASFRERDAAKAVFLKKIERERWAETADLNAIDAREIEMDFMLEISNLSRIRYSQEEILERIEAEEKITRADKGDL